MSDELLTIRLDDETIRVPKGTTFREIIGDRKGKNGLDILLLTNDGVLAELHKTAEKDCVLKSITAADRIGMDTYRRSMNLLFLKAVYDVAGKGVTPHVSLLFSNSNGYYYTIENIGREVDASLAESIKERMLELVERKQPFLKTQQSTRTAREFFHQVGMYDKERLFRYRRVSMVNMYQVEKFKDYNYGYMVGDTGVLKYFDVTAYAEGIVLVLPKASNPTVVEPFKPFAKIFEVQQESEKWADKLGINCVADLNDKVTEGSIGHQMLVAEALQESRISDIAQQIAGRGNIKFVMIAGPSSSGKTTFSRRLSIQLSAHGMIPHPISLDDFYRDRAYCPRDENGELDFECLESLDVDLIQKTLADLLDGKEVEMPHFNFMEGKPEYRGDRLQLGPNDILVIEGIHGLNMKLCENLDQDRIFRVYLSALTQLNVDEHNYISTSDGRLIRRIVRDYRTRGTNARETIERWPSVRRGEEKYIFPNQENADVMFNSALIYELSILKVYAEPLLFQVPTDCPEYYEALRLLKFLDYFIPLPSESVPINSILREFIGGSCFDV